MSKLTFTHKITVWIYDHAVNGWPDEAKELLLKRAAYHGKATETMNHDCLSITFDGADETYFEAVVQTLIAGVAHDFGLPSYREDREAA